MLFCHMPPHPRKFTRTYAIGVKIKHENLCSRKLMFTKYNVLKVDAFDDITVHLECFRVIVRSKIDRVKKA